MKMHSRYTALRTRPHFLTRVLLLILLVPHSLLAHKDHPHEDKPTAEVEKKVPPEIISVYDKNVAPIFKASCFDCHSANTKYPWYSKMPFAKGLIEQDVTEAREHMDMTDGFPFKGHGEVQEDLEAIRDSVTSGEMPPLRYRALHWGSGLNSDEQKLVLDWVEKSLAMLKEKSGEGARPSP